LFVISEGNPRFARIAKTEEKSSLSAVALSGPRPALFRSGQAKGIPPPPAELCIEPLKKKEAPGAEFPAISGRSADRSVALFL
jgi:hypothetical protein